MHCMLVYVRRASERTFGQGGEEEESRPTFIAQEINLPICLRDFHSSSSSSYRMFPQECHILLCYKLLLNFRPEFTYSPASSFSFCLVLCGKSEGGGCHSSGGSIKKS